MKNKILAVLITATIFTGGLVAFANKNIISSSAPIDASVLNISANTSNAPKTEAMPAVTEKNYNCVKPLDVVANPDLYLGKQVKFNATFDKFSTLGLDYKPAFRSSEKYISFLIKRDDVTDHTIPLSEMKIFIKRTEAEKFIELDSGDVIEVYGKVFSNALTDPWIEVDKLVIITKKNKDKK